MRQGTELSDTIWRRASAQVDLLGLVCIHRQTQMRKFCHPQLGFWACDFRVPRVSICSVHEGAGDSSSNTCCQPLPTPIFWIWSKCASFLAAKCWEIFCLPGNLQFSASGQTPDISSSTIQNPGPHWPNVMWAVVQWWPQCQLHGTRAFLAYGLAVSVQENHACLTERRNLRIYEKHAWTSKHLWESRFAVLFPKVPENLRFSALHLQYAVFCFIWTDRMSIKQPSWSSGEIQGVKLCITIISGHQLLSAWFKIWPTMHVWSRTTTRFWRGRIWSSAGFVLSLEVHEATQMWRCHPKQTRSLRSETASGLPREHWSITDAFTKGQ